MSIFRISRESEKAMLPYLLAVIKNSQKKHGHEEQGSFLCSQEVCAGKKSKGGKDSNKVKVIDIPGLGLISSIQINKDGLFTLTVALIKSSPQKSKQDENIIKLLSINSAVILK